MLRLRAPLEAGGSPMVCMSAGFAMVIPGSWTSRNHLRLEAWLGPHYNTLLPNYTRCQQCHLSWSRRLYTSGQESRLDVFLSKAQLSEQLLSHLGRRACRSPRHQTSHIHMQNDKKRYAYSCCVTRARKMHGCRATSLHPIRYYCFRGTHLSLQALVADPAGQFYPL